MPRARSSQWIWLRPGWTLAGISACSTGGLLPMNPLSPMPRRRYGRQMAMRACAGGTGRASIAPITRLIAPSVICFTEHWCTPWPIFMARNSALPDIRWGIRWRWGPWERWRLMCGRANSLRSCSHLNWCCSILTGLLWVRIIWANRAPVMRCVVSLPRMWSLRKSLSPGIDHR